MYHVYLADESFALVVVAPLHSDLCNFSDTNFITALIFSKSTVC